MKVTTKDIIKILPFDNQLKTELVNNYDGFTDVQKSSVAEIVWDAYTALYNLKLEENLELAFLRAGENKESLDKDFYKRVREQTEKEIEKELQQTSTQSDLAAVQGKLAAIITQGSQSSTPSQPSESEGQPPQPQPTPTAR